MRHTFLFAVLLGAVATTACSPFYSVEQSSVERGYRWVSRGNYTQAISTFQVAIRDYPESGLAHLGLADALVEAGRESEAIAAYTKALPLLRANGIVTPASAAVDGQTVGKRPFSYQNQGLRFPHGVEAYVYFRRAQSFAELARRDRSRRDEHLSAAKSDFTSARNLAPSWQATDVRLLCLEEPDIAYCKN
jgi:tetratricopeptide (TPR) repeat protein